LDAFDIQPKGWVCADFGASTGGFTDCLLQNGVTRVYAFEGGSNQLNLGLRDDPRVLLRENCNVRHLKQEDVPEAVDLVVIDVSFISLGLVLASAVGILKSTGLIVCLVKPQFEVGKGRLGKGGVVRKPELWREVLLGHVGQTERAGCGVRNLIVSPLLGQSGNVEFLTELRPTISSPIDVTERIEEALEEAETSKHRLLRIPLLRAEQHGRA